MVASYDREFTLDLFGIAAVFWPALTLVYLFSAFLLLWGIAETIRGLLSISYTETTAFRAPRAWRGYLCSKAPA
jgi:hypothetical protein